MKHSAVWGETEVWTKDETNPPFLPIWLILRGVLASFSPLRVGPRRRVSGLCKIAILIMPVFPLVPKGLRKRGRNAEAAKEWGIR